MFLAHALLILTALIRPSFAAGDCRVLLVVPHPDDEIMIRATLARMRENGCAIHGLYLTQGEGGRNRRWQVSRKVPESTALRKAELAAVRRAEMEDAAQAYGFAEYLQLFHPDVPLRDPVTRKPVSDVNRFIDAGIWDFGRIKTEVSEAATRIEPGLVITFFPGQAGTHAHHQATADLVRELYEEKRLGPGLKSLIGFYEPQFLKSAPQGAYLFSVETKSRARGPNFRRAYGEIGTEGALKHQSQLSGETGNMIRRWDLFRNETLAPIGATESESLVAAFGKTRGLKRLSCPDAIRKALAASLSESGSAEALSEPRR